MDGTVGTSDKSYGMHLCQIGIFSEVFRHDFSVNYFADTAPVLLLVHQQLFII